MDSTDTKRTRQNPNLREMMYDIVDKLLLLSSELARDDLPDHARPPDSYWREIICTRGNDKSLNA